MTPTALPTAKARPSLTTQASSKTGEPGDRLYDRVTIKGLQPGKGAKGRADLYGPFSSVNAKSCVPSRRVGTVAFTPRNGTIRTPSLKVTEPGYYTWVARTSEDSANRAATHRCGLASETTLVRKPAYVLSKVDAGYRGTLLGRAGAGNKLLEGRGQRLTGLAGALNAKVVDVGVRRGSMDLPRNAAVVGRLKHSARIGDAVGTAVVAGHVSDRMDRPGALWDLRGVRKGQVLTYAVDGKKYRYRVTRIQRLERSETLPTSVASTTGAHRLVVITCTDKVVRGGRFHYTHNLVVTAVPIT